MELASGYNIVRIRYTDDCGKFIDARFYEPLILELMNRSKLFFSKPVKHNENQAHSESDFEDSIGRKYESKLIINQSQGQKLGRKINKDIEGFFNEVIKELTEFGNSMKKDGFVDIESTKLYSIIKERLEHIKPDENIILFIPFPLFPEIEGCFFWGQFTDCAQAVYNKLAENSLIGNREFFYIYPIQDGEKYIIRNPRTRQKDYIAMPEYTDYLIFERVM